jgi:hypothetical protein
MLDELAGHVRKTGAEARADQARVAVESLNEADAQWDAVSGDLGLACYRRALGLSEQAAEPEAPSSNNVVETVTQRISAAQVCDEPPRSGQRRPFARLSSRRRLLDLPGGVGG